MQSLKKGFLTLAPLFLLLLLVTACSGEDDNTMAGTDKTSQQPASIFGVWKATGTMYDGVYTPIADECQREIFLIQQDGTGAFRKNCPDGTHIQALTWTQVEGDVYAIDTESTYWPVNYKLTFPEGNNKMYFTYANPQPHEFSKIYEKIAEVEAQSSTL